MAHLNDAIQQSNIVSIGGSCEERCHPMSDLLCHALRTHTVILQKQLDATHKPGTSKSWRNGPAIVNLSCIHPFVYFTILLRVVEQVEAERVRWWENLVQKVHSSFQVARLNQALQQVNTIRAKVLKTRKS